MSVLWEYMEQVGADPREVLEWVLEKHPPQTWSDAELFYELEDEVNGRPMLTT